MSARATPQAATTIRTMRVRTRTMPRGTITYVRVAPRMRSKKGVPIVVVVVLLAAVGAFQACGGTAAKPCVMNMHGKLVEEAKLFKLDVYGSSVHCKGNSVPTDS